MSEIPNEDRLSKTNDQNTPSDIITIKKSTYNLMIKGLVAAMIIIAFVSGFTAATISDGDSVSRQDLKDILTALQEQNTTPPVPVQQPIPQPTPQQPELLEKISFDDDPLKGNPDASVTIVEFSDFQCPFCARFYVETLPLIEENYVNTGKVNLVYRDYPLAFHQNAKAAHIASECADDQKKFWQYHDVLFEKQTEWESLSSDNARKKFLSYASEIGINNNQFITCLDSQKILDEITFDFQEGNTYGITGTPTFFIGNEKHGYTKLTGAQPYQAFVNVIESKMG